MCECKVCGYKGKVKKWTAYELMYGTGDEFNYFECPECGCLQIESIPENLSEYYGNFYYSFNTRADGESKINKNGKRVLDVGSGSGAFLCSLATGVYSELVGCDPYVNEDIFYKNGVSVYKKPIHEMEGKYDYIFMNDSFEHVTDPHEVMDSIKRLLDDDGIAIIKIPVYPNIAFELFGVNWYQLDAPRHIILHSKKSMKYLAERHGLDIVETRWDSNNVQIIRSFLYSKGIRYDDQTQGVIEQYFTAEAVDMIDKQCNMANQNENGDHAIFYLKHKL